ncbi:PAAR domain-containing protein [Albibacillus kandeliae]|uniref:PAAR domain-containing protein n=1 Tax=Albibacillus kandeliae TaxID=2174228 RepID=UPI000D687EB6|nr:PAAR domain-containing protein [Albibacillus kandeliae]
MGMPQARLGDMCGCCVPAPPPAPPVPPPGAPLPIAMVGAPTVLVGKKPAARVTDQHVSGTGPHPIVKGSMTVMISSLPAARIMDNAACGGMVVLGEFTVLTGG